MSSRIPVKAFYWIVVAASVTASIMAVLFVATMWPQISAYAAVTTDALAAIFILLPTLNLLLWRVSYANRLGAALALIATQAGILFI